MLYNNPMFVFIDESGIHKENGNSVFALVYITIQHYTEFEKAIIGIEKELDIDSFHWSTVPWVVREKFLEKLLTLDFKRFRKKKIVLILQ